MSKRECQGHARVVNRKAISEGDRVKVEYSTSACKHAHCINVRCGRKGIHQDPFLGKSRVGFTGCVERRGDWSVCENVQPYVLCV